MYADSLRQSKMKSNPAPKPPAPKTIKETLADALNDVADRVSVAGVKEALQENVVWVKRIYQIILLPLIFLSVYYTWNVIIWWRRGGYADEITDFAEVEWLPVSNVTVCAQVYFNKTFVKENVTVSPDLFEKYTKENGVTEDEFYNQLAIFLSIIIRDRKFSPLQISYLNKILRQNNQIADYTAFAEASLPTCENVLKKCWFGGKEFDCCKRAVRSIDEDGICFLLTLNFDSDNAFPAARTVKQTKPGPAGGLIVDARLEVKDFPWLEEDADDGFKIYVNAVPYTSVQSPMTSPNGAETFVKVKAVKRLSSAMCTPRNQLAFETDFGLYYDPEGFGCAYKEFLSVAHKYIPCHFPLFTYRPNVSIACSPYEAYILAMVFSTQYLQAKAKQLVGTFLNADQATKAIRKLEDDWKASYSEKARCLKHCQYWEYSSTSSFVYLEKDGGIDRSNDTVMFSRMHVYYADLSYRQFDEVKEITVYLAFCEFGNVVGLYLGMSIVSFFHVIYYVPRYWLILCKSRKSRNKVMDAPAIEITRAH